MVTFDPRCYEVNGLREAFGKACGPLVFGPDDTTRITERLGAETAYTIELCVRKLALFSSVLVADYGCGPGRIARGLIEQTDCRCIGIDASPSMLYAASHYVSDPRFTVAAPGTMADGICDAAMSLWMLQHCFDPLECLHDIHRILKPGGRIFVMNEDIRYVPTIEMGFVDDGVNVLEACCSVFYVEEVGKLDPGVVGQKFSDRSFWALLTKPASF